MAKQGEERAADIDHLYGLPLDEFTSARDALARELRQKGDGDAAQEVKGLRKPSAAAWALNQVRRNNPGQSDELLEAGRHLGEAQERLLAGGDREQFQEATAEERRLVAELARHAERELVAAGRSVSAGVQEKVRATLHALASVPEAREGFEAGRLVRDHEPSALGSLGQATAPSGGTGAAKQKEKPSAREKAALERKRRQLEERLERSQARKQELDEEFAEAKRGLREARREAARAVAALERAEATEEQTSKRADEAAAAVRELERELRRLTNGGSTGR